MVTSVTQGSVTASYTYNSSNQRALQTTSTEVSHYYGFDGDTHSEWQSFPGGSSRWIDYIHSPGGLVGAVYKLIPTSGAATVTTLYYAQDHLGSIAASVVSDGSNRALRSYDSWGKQRFTTGLDDSANTLMGQNAEARGFLGEEQVAAITLVNLNRRMYDPWVGRFMQPDPIATPGDLQGMNPYSYPGNNPLTCSDPSGMCGGFLDCVLGGGFLSDLIKAGSTFVHRAFGPAAPIVVVAVAVATFYYGGPALLGTSLSEMSPALLAANAAISGAVAGAINTGTPRGALIGGAAAAAFWGAGQVGGLLWCASRNIRSVRNLNRRAGRSRLCVECIGWRAVLEWRDIRQRWAPPSTASSACTLQWQAACGRPKWDRADAYAGTAAACAAIQAFDPVSPCNRAGT